MVAIMLMMVMMVVTMLMLMFPRMFPFCLVGYAGKLMVTMMKMLTMFASSHFVFHASMSFAFSTRMSI